VDITYGAFLTCSNRGKKPYVVFDFQSFSWILTFGKVIFDYVFGEVSFDEGIN
jgi:hypothetical protein